jgi:hypothetical protein
MLKRLMCIVATFLAIVLVLNSCQTVVEPSPDPGILRVTLKANEADTTIIIQSDTSRLSRWDEFNLTVSQGRLYRGSNHALLYANRSIDRIQGSTVNILHREWLNGVPIKKTDITEINTKNSRYRTDVVFECFVPPGTYDSLTFTLTATEILIFIPKVYQNPVQLPPGTRPQMQLSTNMTVNEGRVTQVNLEILPFGSLSRYRDSYLFDRKVRVVGVDNL